MAGVKTTRGGVSKPPRFTVTDCAQCGSEISKLADGTLVLTITFPNGKRRSQKHWMHRRCIGADTGKK